MTKGELIEKLLNNRLPDDTPVFVSVGKYHDGEATWDEIVDVDDTEPILIFLGETVMC